MFNQTICWPSVCDSSPKNENTIIIYSLSCRLKTCLTFILQWNTNEDALKNDFHCMENYRCFPNEALFNRHLRDIHLLSGYLHKLCFWPKTNVNECQHMSWNIKTRQTLAKMVTHSKLTHALSHRAWCPNITQSSMADSHARFHRQQLLGGDDVVPHNTACERWQRRHCVGAMPSRPAS